MHNSSLARAIAPLLLAFCLQAQVNVTVTASDPVSKTILGSAVIQAAATPASVTFPAGAVNVTAQLSTQPALITLPIEVFGPENTTASASFGLPATTSVNGTAQLWIQIHGLRYDSEASVQVNNSVWLPLSTGNVTLLGNAAAFGGIGGGYSTISMTVNLPPGVVASGTNKVTFRFNGTNGVTSGFRVLGFNLQVNGANLIPPATFVYDDPSKWTAPSSSAADIAAGKALWTSAALSDPAAGALVPIKAHCADCHTSDGRDLKYFNYSNLSIETRATFHGLTAQQGLQLASYIRSLNVPSPGRPWNPPYQPGPGMDSQPVASWAAGAGLSAVLSTDQQMLPYIQPITAAGYLNARETPVVFELPDWNSWLPIVHPIDGFGTFQSSTLATAFQAISKQIAAAPTATQGYKSAAATGYPNLFAAEIAFGKSNALPATWTPALRQSFYSVGLWELVRQWDLNQTFGLESMPQVVYPKPSSRGWYAAGPFGAAPNIQHVQGGPGLFNGSDVSGLYANLAWYILQEVVNDGQGTQSGHTPQDYGYVAGFFGKMFGVSTLLPGAALQMEFSIKALQTYTLAGTPPSSNVGWQPMVTSPMTLVGFNQTPEWRGYTLAQISSLLTPLTQAWFAQASTYTPAQYYAGGFASATEDPSKTNYSQTFSGNVWYMLPNLRYYGVPASLTKQISAWAKTIWPLGNWAANDALVCTAPSLISPTACK